MLVEISSVFTGEIFPPAAPGRPGRTAARCSLTISGLPVQPEVTAVRPSPTLQVLTREESFLFSGGRGRNKNKKVFIFLYLIILWHYSLL